MNGGQNVDQDQCDRRMSELKGELITSVTNLGYKIDALNACLNIEKVASVQRDASQTAARLLREHKEDILIALVLVLWKGGDAVGLIRSFI